MYKLRKLLTTVVIGLALCACGGNTGSAPLSNGSALAQIGQQTYRKSPESGARSVTTNASSYELYVTNAKSNELTTYKEHGERTGPTIKGLKNPQSVAVDSSGKIYVANLGNDTVTTYNPDGSQASPTISGLRQPIGVAVDISGKIYVTERAANRLTTYNADGSPSTPTIRHLDKPGGVAVSASGLIYVASTGEDSVRTYNPDGSQTTPTITDVSSPVGIALGDDDGLLYVVEKGAMTVYEASTGQSAGASITGVTGDFVAASPGLKNRKVFIANTGSGQVNAYTPDGHSSEPNIIKGLSDPSGIAVH